MNRLDRIIVLAASVGERIIICGGEIERAEDSAHRICTAYGLENISVFALNSVIIVTAADKESCFTHSIRINVISPCMKALENINGFSRQICNNPVDIEKAMAMLDDIALENPKSKKILGEIITAVAFTMFFYGSLSDIACTVFIVILLHFQKSGLEKINLRQYMGYVVLTFATGMLIQLLRRLSICDNPQAIMHGCFMSMFPGISLVNASLSFLSSNTISAILQLVHSILTAISIAAGFAFSAFVFGIF